MNLIKLLLIGLKLCFVFTQITENKSSGNSAQNERHEKRSQHPIHEKTQFRQLQDFLTESVNNFKLEFHRSFEESRIKQKQRDNFLFSLPEKGVLIEEQLRVENASAVYPGRVLTNMGANGPIRMWTVIEYMNYTYLFWGHPNGVLVLADFRVTPMGPQIRQLANYVEKGNGMPFKAKYFIYESKIWLVVAFRSREREYLSVYQFNPHSGQFHRRQTISTDMRCDFDITTLKGSPYLAVTSYMRRTSVGQTLQSTVNLYEWRHTQFDFIAQQKTFSATSVKLFPMANTLYIVVSQEFNRSMSVQIDYYNHFPVRGSPVLLYNARDDEKLTYVQIIPNFGSRVEHFRVDGNNYLVFDDPNDISRIYWWGGDQFLIYQDLFESRHAIDMSVVRLPNAEILLAFLFPNRVQFYTESLSAKYVLNGHLETPEASFKSIRLFSSQMHYFSLFTFNENWKKSSLSPIWSLTFKTFNREIQDSYDPLRTCLLKLEQTLTKREDELRRLTARADKVWMSNTAQKLTAPVIVRGRVRANTITAQKVFITNNNRKVPQITNTEVKNRADQLSMNLQKVNKDMNNLVYKSKNQTIRGRINFSQTIIARHLSIKNIANRDLLLNGVPFNQLTDNTLRVNGNQVISAHFTFNGLKVDQLLVSGLINNLNVSDALLADSPQPQVVTGSHRYGELVLLKNLLLNNKFGSINGIFAAHFVTKFGANQQINGQKVFNSLEAKNIDVIGTINGRDLSDIADRAVLLNGANQVITGQWIMDSPISVRRIKLKGLINRVVNVSEIAFNAVTIYGEQSIAGLKTFRAPVAVMADIELTGKVNGIKLSKDCITTNTEQVITGNIVFRGPVEFANNLDSDSINGVDFSADCLLRNGSKPQLVNKKYFNKTLVSLNDITMDSGSTIDGTDPSELLKLVISNRNTAFEAPVSFNKLSVGGNILAKTINHFLINDLPNILWLKTVNQTIRVPVVFEGLIKSRQLLSPKINGFSLPNEFIHKSLFPNQQILGQKTFASNVVINGNVVQREGTLLNGIDLKAFAKQTVGKYNNLSDYIRGPKHFQSVRVLGQVIVGTVNGLNISTEILLTNSRQTINGNIRLMSAQTHINGRLEVMSDINVKTTVNNYWFSQFANDVVLANRFPHTYQRPLINKVFVAGVGAQHMTALGTISGVDINDMNARVVTLNTEQHVFGAKNFTSITHFNNDLFSDHLNGLPIHDYSQRVVFKNKPTTVRGSKTFAGSVLIRSNVELTKTINAIDVRSLQRRIMSRIRDNVILAPMTFGNDINLGDLQLTPPMATIDGLRTNQLALIGHNLRINGNIVFNRSVSVRTDIRVSKTVNGCDLRLLSANAVLHGTTSHIQSIHSTKQFNNLEVLGNVVIQGLVNGVDINGLATRIVTKTGNQRLTAPLTFENDVIVDRLIVKNLINGKNISLILSDAVVKSRPQIITSRKTFLRPLLANGSRTQLNGYVNVEGLVNGVDVVRLNQTAVRQESSKAISGRKTFAGRVTFKRDVFIGGTLSGIKFPNDLILVNTNELISGTTTLQEWIAAKKSVTVNGLIDGINLSYFVGNRLTLTDGNQLIESLLNFTNRVTVDKLIVRKTINNIPIDAFVTTKGRHIISGIKTFGTDLFVSGNIVSNGIYNNINIHDLNNRAVSLVRPNEVVNGVTEFTFPVNMHHMAINGRLNGYDISDMANFFGRFTTEVNQLLTNIRQQINRQETALTAQFTSHLKYKSSGIAYFIVSQEIYERAERFLIDSYKPSVFSVRPIESLILWSYKSGNGGQCRLYSSITYSISEKGFITSETIREFGRNIPLKCEKLFGKQDLSLWTNTTVCDSRLNEHSLMESIHIDPVSGQAFTTFVTNDRYPTYRVSAPVLKDAKLFVSNNRIFVVLAQNYDKIRKSFHTNSTVMALDSRTNRWFPIQQLETFGAHSIDVITYGKDRRIFFAIANRFHSRSQSVHSVILEWNPITQQFVINTVVLTSNPSAVIFVEGSDGQLYCVFANEKTKLFENNCNDYENSLYTQPINVYKLNGKSFHYFQSIDINGVISLDSFQVSNHTYIAAGSPLLGTTFILQLRGYNKFEVIESIPTSGVQNVKSFWSSDGSLHLAIASSELGHTKILTAIINGSHNVKKYSTIEELLIDSKLMK